MPNETLSSVKLSLGVSHSKKDADFIGSINACLMDLSVCGVTMLNEQDPLILLAIKFYCHSIHDPDTVRRTEFKQRYDDLKGTLKGATGYGREIDENE